MTKKKMKNFLIFIFSMLVISIISIVIYSELSQKYTSYFSITSTDINFRNHYLIYDDKSKQLSEILNSTDTAQYPLGYLDRVNNRLYYVKNDENGDQIYSYNIGSKTEKKITINLYAVNDMFIFRDKIYATAMIKGQKNISLVAINTINNKIEIISERDFNVESIALKKSSKMLYYVGYNMNEQLELIETYEKNNDGGQLKNATSKLFAYNIVNREVNLEYESEKMITQIAVMDTDEKAIMKLSEDVFTDYKFYWFDLNKKQIESEILFKDIVRIDDMGFSNDDSRLYFLGVKKISTYNQNDASQTAPSNYLYEYEIKTAKINEILTIRDRYMNNFEVIKN